MPPQWTSLDDVVNDPDMSIGCAPTGDMNAYGHQWAIVLCFRDGEDHEFTMFSPSEPTEQQALETVLSDAKSVVGGFNQYRQRDLWRTRSAMRDLFNESMQMHKMLRQCFGHLFGKVMALP